MRPPILDGLLRALLLAPGVIPLGLVFGATAAAAGFSPVSAAAFSVVVFAGATQFAVVALMETGAGLAAITALVLIMNARYLLLSAAALELGRRAAMGRPSRIALALGVVEESYALQAAWAQRGPAPGVGLLAVAASLMVLWTASTFVGADLGARFPSLEPLGLDYALPGIFVGLVGVFATDRRRVAAAGVALAAGGALALAGWSVVAILLVPLVVALVFSRRGAPADPAGAVP